MHYNLSENIADLRFFCFNNFPKKLIPGYVRDHVLQEPVGDSHAGQGRKSGVPDTFLDPGGQARSNGTPQLGLVHPSQYPRGVEDQLLINWHDL